MKLSKRPFIAALCGIAVIAMPAPSHAVDGLAVGACVTVRNEGPGRIISLNQGGYVVLGDGAAPSEARNWPRSYVTPGACNGNAAVQPQPAGQQRTCFASDPDSKGATALEVTLRRDIRGTFEKRPLPGADGSVTISFQSFQIAPPRPWSPIDSVNFTANQTKPVYIVRSTFTTCEDYRLRLVIRRSDRNFACYTAVTGQLACTTLANFGGDMAEDQTQEIIK